MYQYLKLISTQSSRSLTIFALIVGILMGCQSPYEEVITKDEAGNVASTYTIRKEDGVKHGNYQVFIGGKLSEEGNFKDGKQDGVRKLLFPNGKIEVEETYKDGNILTKKVFFDNGELSVKGQYDEAVTMSGEWTYYYQNGKIKEVVNFKNSVEDGVFKEYYENGNLKAEGTYAPLQLGVEIEGVEQGELKEYDENGELVATKNCELGRCTTIWTKETE
jgi:antitoxin component YwqK of YwqJK toxin-antitoxin module